VNPAPVNIGKIMAKLQEVRYLAGRRRRRRRRRILMMMIMIMIIIMAVVGAGGAGDLDATDNDGWAVHRLRWTSARRAASGCASSAGLPPRARSVDTR
jgi:hypothetical protein